MAAKWRSGGGGFLNGVTGDLVGYKFEAKEWESTKKGGDDYSTLSMELLIQQDGADEPVQQFLNGGFFYPDNQSISDDGLTLESDDERGMIAADSEVAAFIDSLNGAGFPEAPFEETNWRNFEAMVGGRYTYKREIDKEATERFGKRKSKKDGKEYNRDKLLVAAVVALPEDNKKSAKKGAKGKSASKTTAKPAATKSKKKEADTEDADTAIVTILEGAKDNTIKRADVSMAVVRYAAKEKLSKDDRESLRKQLSDVEYLEDAAERGIITFDAKDKKQPISLPEDDE